MNEINIPLSAEQFEQLASGEVIEINFLGGKETVVKICLQDIGYDLMKQIIFDAEIKKAMEKL